MFRLPTFLLLALSAVATLASPAGRYEHTSQCLSTVEAQQVADNYAQLIRNYTYSLAQVALAPNFVDRSESVNALINGCPQGSAAITRPLLSPSFSNRTQFELGQGQQAPINFKTLHIWKDCTAVTMRWETTNTAPLASNPKPVVGIIVLEAIKAPTGNRYPWIIKNVFSEFDSATWLQNLERAGLCNTNSTIPSSPSITVSGAVITASATPAP